MSREPPRRDNGEETQQVLTDEDLDTALDTLQTILERRRVVQDEFSTDPDKASSSWEQEHESLPLLNEVVLPGTMLEDEKAAVGGATTPTEPMEPMPSYGDLISRLASELDVIIEGCVDDALRQAKQELMVQIKHHLDIVLPEILYELVKRKAEDQDFSQ